MSSLFRSQQQFGGEDLKTRKTIALTKKELDTKGERQMVVRGVVREKIVFSLRAKPTKSIEAAKSKKSKFN